MEDKKLWLEDTVVPMANPETIVTTPWDTDGNQDRIKDVLLEPEIIPCPHTEWETIRPTLNPDQQKEMIANIGKKDSEGKIEIIPLKIKVFPLTAEPNGTDIIDGNHRDEKGKAPIDSGIQSTYLSPEQAKKQCAQQGKRYLTDNKDGSACLLQEEYERIMNIINHFPGETEWDKIANIKTLFGIESTGFFNYERKRLEDETHIVLSRLPNEGSTINLSRGDMEDKKVLEIFTMGDYMAEIFAGDAIGLFVTLVCEDSVPQNKDEIKKID